jgi:ubiquitin C-terminal hydrolase
MVKLQQRVDFPLVLNIAPQLAYGHRKCLYSLAAVIVHHGSAWGGHYTTYRKVRVPLCNGTVREKWFHVSDEHVQLVTESDVLNTEAYMLLYSAYAS